jgi:hypothetical protein
VRRGGPPSPANAAVVQRHLTRSAAGAIGAAVFVGVAWALPAPAATHASLSVLPADGQTVKYRLTGDRQTLAEDVKFNNLITLVRTGNTVAVTSVPDKGTTLPGNARLLNDGSLLIDIGDLAVQLDAITLASTVAVKAPVPLSLVSTWTVPAPVVVAAARVTVPLSVIVSDAAPEHTALSAQGRAKAQLPGKDGPLDGNVSVTFALNFTNGAFTSASGDVFSDASPSANGAHEVIHWHLEPQS